MKKWLIGFAVVLTTMLGTAQAQQFEEGKHFEVIADNPTDKPVVQEYFSLYCVHCYQFEPIAEEIAKTFPEKFEKIHVSMINPTGDMGQTMSRAYVAAEKLGIARKFIDTVFDYHFKKRTMLTSKEDIRNVFIVNGISGDEFDKAIASFSVRATASQNDRMAMNYDVSATPTFIVNGKYKLLPTGFRDSEDFSGDFIKLIKYLLSNPV
ncbi:disulfide isomerase [Idiomarina tyrosinivorans]|uniref:Thiol:disulfide interchange protein n=1 Tax=Idiomarina tyrosinivorans TaxID=1445662 RepID=A0A432ZSW0_9GAMM|nr:thiol:disulfide interchange protein DsbA/DsbL [Idiomarina tyrosinivorans]RUO80918.1 disulfide isomerase [Idiomarina tyrosinivorans]